MSHELRTPLNALVGLLSWKPAPVRRPRTICGSPSNRRPR
ncbi:hypothetical protein K5F93_11860 [Pseudomonas protegens]|nr:hypothetical protein K5F93_11860 [Pseudomonas protegens]